MNPKQIRQQKIIMLVFSAVFIPVGLICLYFSYIIYTDVLDYSDYTSQTKGIVVEMKRSVSERKDHRGDYKTETNYNPIIEFTTESGDTIQFASGMVTTIRSYYEIGEEVEVFYNPDEPQQAEIDAFLPVWGIHIVLIGLGVLSLVAGIFVFYSYLRFRKKYP